MSRYLTVAIRSPYENVPLVTKQQINDCVTTFFLCGMVIYLLLIALRYFTLCTSCLIYKKRYWGKLFIVSEKFERIWFWNSDYLDYFLSFVGGQPLIPVLSQLLTSCFKFKHSLTTCIVAVKLGSKMCWAFQKNQESHECNLICRQDILAAMPLLPLHRYVLTLDAVIINVQMA